MDEAEVDYIIVGQGVAGSMLAHFLLKENKKIIVTDAVHHASSSRVAAGIFNPVTGWRMVKTWRVDTLFPFAEKTYRELEELLGQKFYYSKNTYRIFSSFADQNDWAFKKRSANVERYMEGNTDDAAYAKTVNNEFGGFEIRESGYVNIEALVNAFRLYLEANKLLHSEKLEYADIELTNDGAIWKGIKARRIVFCEGYGLAKNPFFNFLPLAPVKGELLTIRSEELKVDTIISKGIYIVPLGDGIFRVGATYDFNNINEEVTEEGKNELQTKLANVLKVPYTILDHKAGIRPATKDRRPLLGFHPQHPQLAVFNGMGTKGISLAPWFANHLMQVMEYRTPLDPEADIRRFVNK